MSIEIDVLDGNQSWPIAEPLFNAVWPPEIVAKLRSDVRAVLPDLKERFEKSGGVVFDLPNDKLDGFVKSEYETWTKLIREADIKLDSGNRFF